LTLFLRDVDGTLFNAGGAGRWALARAFESVFDLSGLEDRAAEVRFDGRTDPLIIADIAAVAGVNPERLNERARLLERTYLRFLEERLSRAGASRPLPGVEGFLARLRQKAIPFGLLTGNIESGARMKVRAAGIEDRFDAGAYGNDAAERATLGRIARERFESILRRPIGAAEVVVIGDSVEDVRAARANGYRCLAVTTGWTKAERLMEESPDAVFTDLSDTEAVMTWIGPEA
jgi:phosphoglycolate phosphatase